MVCLFFCRSLDLADPLALACFNASSKDNPEDDARARCEFKEGLGIRELAEEPEADVLTAGWGGGRRVPDALRTAANPPFSNNSERSRAGGILEF